MPKLNIKTDRGTALTKSCCIRMNEPYLICNRFEKISVNKIKKWLGLVTPKTLNIGSQKESVVSGIESVTKSIVVEILRK